MKELGVLQTLGAEDEPGCEPVKESSPFEGVCPKSSMLIEACSFDLTLPPQEI